GLLVHLTSPVLLLDGQLVVGHQPKEAVDLSLSGTQLDQPETARLDGVVKLLLSGCDAIRATRILRRVGRGRDERQSRAEHSASDSNLLHDQVQSEIRGKTAGQNRRRNRAVNDIDSLAVI